MKWIVLHQLKRLEFWIDWKVKVVTQLQFWSFDVKTFCNRQISNKLNCFQLILLPGRLDDSEIRCFQIWICVTLYVREGTLSRGRRKHGKNRRGKIIKSCRNYKSRAWDGYVPFTIFTFWWRQQNCCLTVATTRQLIISIKRWESCVIIT